MNNGIDLGNYNVKTSERDIITAKPVIFKAKYSTKEKIMDNNNCLQLNGKHYYIEDGELETNLNKSKKLNILPLLYTAIIRSTRDIDNNVVLGLPVSQFKANKDSLKKYILDNGSVQCKYNGEQREIRINNVEIFPECAGAYFSIKDKPADCILVDIGGRTTNICLFEDGKLTKKYISIPAGMINIYDDIAEYLNTKFTLDIKMEQIESILKKGLFVDGMKIDFSFIKPIINEYFDIVINELNLNYPVRTHRIFLSGGGSLIVGGSLKKRLKGAQILENTLLANAIGFKKVGDQLWQKNSL